MSGLDQRRPSASLRTRRPSTVYNEVDEHGVEVPAVPVVPNTFPGYSFNNSGLAPPNDDDPGRPPSRPQARHAKSSDSDVRGGGAAPGRSRAGTSASRDAGGAGGGGEPSKVGAILLNKRQSVSFGKAMAANARAGVRGDEGYNSGSGQGGRYNDAMGRGGPPPPMPALAPGGSRRGATLDGSGMSAGEEMVHKGPRGPNGTVLNELLKEDFVADAFLRSHFSPGAASNQTTQLEDLRALKAALNSMLDTTQTSLQTNVIQNYHEFIKVSKDISALENEMLELKSVLEEWKTVPEGLEIEQSFDPHANSGRNRRNSLADLQALYRTQLETLWESVEGSQRFLPVVPNRHILNRFSSWIELNSATYRARQAVILVLLNDALLVAVEKRRQMGGAVRVVADKCFHLNEIAVTDLKDAGELTNAIRIKRDREVHIFRTEKPEEKRALLSAFKKILEETMSRRRKESVWEAEHRRDTTYGSSRRGGMAGAPTDDAPTRHPLAGFRPSTIFTFVTGDDPTGKDLSWIDDVSDQLAVHIALREFEEAVALIEKSKSILPTVEADPLASSLLRSKIEVRSRELCQVLLASLADTGIRKTGVVKMSGWLLRLGQGERARETFLGGRGELLKRRTGDIRFTSQGDGSPTTQAMQESSLVNEVAELAFVCFTLIRNTCEWYMAAYKDHQTASAFVRWASTQVEVFADIFKRQVYGTAPHDSDVAQKCLETATSQAAMLKDVGLDFAFLLSSSLRTSISHPAVVESAQAAPPFLGSGPVEAQRRPSDIEMPPAVPLVIKKKKVPSEGVKEDKVSALPFGVPARRPTS